MFCRFVVSALESATSYPSSAPSPSTIFKCAWSRRRSLTSLVLSVTVVDSVRRTYLVVLEARVVVLEAGAPELRILCRDCFQCALIVRVTLVTEGHTSCRQNLPIMTVFLLGSWPTRIRASSVRAVFHVHGRFEGIWVITPQNHVGSFGAATVCVALK